MRTKPERLRLAAVAALVLLLHVVAFRLLDGGPAPRREPARTSVTLRIVAVPRIAVPLETSPQARENTTARARPPVAARTAPARPARETRETHDDTAQPPAPPPAPQAITVVPAEPPAPASVPASAPLRLDLPSGTATAVRRNPALGDPRANTIRPDAGERLARAIGSDTRLHEEARGDGRLRVRQGADCVDVRPARGADLDPMNQGVRPMPKLVEPCP